MNPITQRRKPVKPRAIVPFEHWMWIELLAFDNESPDFGVQAFLDKTGFVPDVMLLFLYSADFLHTHQGMKTEWIFPPHYCSYAGRPCNKERSIQPWTNLQLHGLIAGLHQHGVRAYCSVMSQFVGYQQGDHVRGNWAKEHPELMETRKNGGKIAALFPLHRFPDGSYYEDFFCKILVAVLKDYGFDGFHAADGYSSPRLPLWETDYSDDMVDQFCQTAGKTLPKEFAGQCEGNPDRMEQRAGWIWAHCRLEWIEFYANRWEHFCAKVCAALHAHGKTIALNNAWTKDPFQALYRYGVDYARLVRAGVDGFISENVGAGVSIGADGIPPADPYYEFMAMPFMMKAYTPQVPINHLSGTRDTFEQWDVLAHARTVLEREIYSLSSLRIWNAKAGWQACCAGPVHCLSTDVLADEWRWLQDKWRLGFSMQPSRELGATVIWSDEAFRRQLPEFVATRRWTTHKLVYELLAQGVPLHTVARIEDLGTVSGPLVVLNPHLYPQEELKALLAYDRGPVIMIGDKAQALPKADLEFADVYPPGELWCWVYGASPLLEIAIAKEGEENIPPDLLAVPEPIYYPQALYFRKVSAGFLKACTEAIVECAGAPKVSGGSKAVKVFAMQGDDRLLRVYMGNDSQYYASAEIDVRHTIESIKTITDFPPMPVLPKGSKFAVRVPSGGMVILEVTLQSKGVAPI